MIRVEPIETGSKRSLSFEARCGADRCGHITAVKTKIGSRVVYVVTDVNVAKDFRRQGIATRLYEAAADEACKRRSRLASNQRNAGAKSNEFWEKQVAKGRAEPLGPDPKLIKSLPPDQRRRFDRYILNVCGSRIDLSRSVR